MSKMIPDFMDMGNKNFNLLPNLNYKVILAATAGIYKRG